MGEVHDRSETAGRTPGRLTPAGLSRSAWARFSIVFIVGLILDLGSKWWTFANVADAPVVLDRSALVADRSFDPIPPHLPLAALPYNLLDITLVLNPGAVFGIGAERPLAIIAFTVLALLLGVLMFALRTTAQAKALHLAFGLAAAGAIGNFWDRAAYGRVRDFLHALPGRRLPGGATWPGTQNPELFPWVFNIADLLLLAGMIMLLIGWRRGARDLVASRAGD